MEKVVIFGVGELSQLAKYYLDNDNRFEVVGFTVDSEYIIDSFEGLSVVSFDDIERFYPNDRYKLFITIGYSKVNSVREKKYKEAKEKGYECISYISPEATMASNVVIGENCFIFENNNIQPYVEIGNNCILWSGNHIGHHSLIRDNCFITSHVVISGGVEVGGNTFIGVNATLRDHIKIGKANVIGAGALILSDTDDNKVFMEKATEPSRVPSSRLRRI